MDETMKEENPTAATNEESSSATTTNEVAASAHKKKELPEVSVVRNWKEYLGECALIVFSVLLALGLTEYFNNLHEKSEAKEILHQLKDELISNKQNAALQYAYHLQVFKNIDSAKKNPAYAKKFLDSSGNLHLNVLMPHGALFRDMNEVAWQEAKQNDVFKYLDIQTYSILTDAYGNQERFLNLEPSLAGLLISYESRKPENLQVTLTLIHDALFAWIVQRTPDLLEKYQRAIDRLKNY
jgi:hypothetical protein